MEAEGRVSGADSRHAGPLNTLAIIGPFFPGTFFTENFAPMLKATHEVNLPDS